MKRNEQIALVKLLAQSVIESCEKYENSEQKAHWCSGKFPYHPVLGLTVIRQNITRLRTELSILSKMFTSEYERDGGE